MTSPSSPGRRERFSCRFCFYFTLFNSLLPAVTSSWWRSIGPRKSHDVMARKVPALCGRSSNGSQQPVCCIIDFRRGQSFEKGCSQQNNAPAIEDRHFEQHTRNVLGTPFVRKLITNPIATSNSTHQGRFLLRVVWGLLLGCIGSVRLWQTEVFAAPPAPHSRPHDEHNDSARTRENLDSTIQLSVRGKSKVTESWGTGHPGALREASPGGRQRLLVGDVVLSLILAEAIIIRDSASTKRRNSN